MNISTLYAEKIIAMRESNALRKTAVNNMIDAIQKAAITPKGRVEITDQLVDEVLIRHQKSIQEMIDTCPEARTDLLALYEAEMAVVKEFAPQLLVDKIVIETTVREILEREGIEPSAQNKGKIMKTLAAQLKGKADMKIVGEVVGGMI